VDILVPSNVTSDSQVVGVGVAAVNPLEDARSMHGVLWTTYAGDVYQLPDWEVAYRQPRLGARELHP